MLGRATNPGGRSTNKHAACLRAAAGSTDPPSPAHEAGTGRPRGSAGAGFCLGPGRASGRGGRVVIWGPWRAGSQPGLRPRSPGPSVAPQEIGDLCCRAAGHEA